MASLRGNKVWVRPSLFAGVNYTIVHLLRQVDALSLFRCPPHDDVVAELIIAL